MNAKDLMIGDWVKSRGKIEQVREVYEGYICTDSFEDSHDYYFDPIPLTPEILEKNGFIRDGESWWYKDFRIVLFSSNGVSLICGRQMRFKYVHELQHALRLCGIEKEIML